MARTSVLTLILIGLLELSQLDRGACSGSGSARLLTDLFPRARDVAARHEEDAQPHTISLGLALRQLISVDERNQIITAAVWVRQYWADSRLSWDPQDYNDTTEVHVPANRHWKPDLVLYNNAAESSVTQLDHVISVVNHTGHITYMFPATYQFSCVINVQDFPFDQQDCDIKLGSWAYSSRYVDLQLKSQEPADLHNYHYDSEWGLVHFTATRHVQQYGCCDDAFVDVTWRVTLRRRYALYMWYLVLPSILISALAALQFLLPCEAGEKITLGITVLLSLVVFLLLMADILPITENVPLIAKYMSATLILVGISQVITIITLRVHHNGTHDNHLQMPGWARRRVLHGLARLLRMRHLITDDEEHVEKLQVYDSHTSVELEPVEETEMTTMHPIGRVGDLAAPPTTHNSTQSREQPVDAQPSKMSVNFFANQRRRSSVIVRQSSDLILAKILQQLEEFHFKWTEGTRHEEVSCEWQQLAMLLDRLFLYIYLVVSLLVLPAVFANRTWHHAPIQI